jgi:hypothetical protein
VKGQFGKFVDEWEDSFKVLYICIWCVLDLVKHLSSVNSGAHLHKTVNYIGLRFKEDRIFS